MSPALANLAIAFPAGSAGGALLAGVRRPGYHRPRPSKPAGACVRRRSGGPRQECVRPLSDGLLQRVSRGDAAAVRECLDRYSGLVWSLARRLTFSDAEAEDAVQEIFVEVWKNAGRYDSAIASETAFVAMIARRRLIDRRRRAERRPEKALGGDDFVGDGDGALERPGLSDEAARALEAMRSLSPEQQRVLRLSIMHGLSHDKIATSTGLPMGTVKTHARRGLMRLRELLKPGPARAAGQEPVPVPGEVAP